MKKNSATIKRTKADAVFDTVNLLIMILLFIIVAYPLYFIIVASVSDPYEVAKGNVFLWPKGFTLAAYKNTFSTESIWIGYRNSLIYTVFGTALSLVLTLSSAYVLSKRYLPGRKLLATYFLIPMYFGGGMIPTYLQIKTYGLINQPYTLIVVGAISIYNIIVTRVFYESSIPEELYESGRIDGANELRLFFSFALPLSLPIIAVMSLYYGVGKWNNYFSALLYTSKADYQPLQMVLRGILLMNKNALSNLDISSMNEDQIINLAQQSYMAEAMKYSTIVVASLPMMIAYPFVQKNFVKGVMIGAIKT